ncbi:MAG: FAD:protein FMN transferase [Gemmatimonas sp.]
MKLVELHSFPCMGTVVAFHVVKHDASTNAAHDAAIARARAWFTRVEQACSRFDGESELRLACTNIGTPVHVSDLLFEATQFALAVADASDGAFDPTIGTTLEDRGFDRDYRTGHPSRFAADSTHPTRRASFRASYRDVELDASRQTITVQAPLLLDLSAVAKGLAIDLATRELRGNDGDANGVHDFMIDAGGDLFVSGLSASDEPWSVGIRHPRRPEALLATLDATDTAVCTSGDYERAGVNGSHHLIDARNHSTASALASVTVIAPSAMVADALGTAAFALGPQAGCEFLQSHQVEGLLVTPTLDQLRTRGWKATAHTD